MRVTITINMPGTGQHKPRIAAAAIGNKAIDGVSGTRIDLGIRRIVKNAEVFANVKPTAITVNGKVNRELTAWLLEEKPVNPALWFSVDGIQFE